MAKRNASSQSIAAALAATLAGVPDPAPVVAAPEPAMLDTVKIAGDASIAAIVAEALTIDGERATGASRSATVFATITALRAACPTDAAFYNAAVTYYGEAGNSKKKEPGLLGPALSAAKVEDRTRIELLSIVRAIAFNMNDSIAAIGAANGLRAAYNEVQRVKKAKVVGTTSAAPAAPTAPAKADLTMADIVAAWIKEGKTRELLSVLVSALSASGNTLPAAPLAEIRDRYFKAA